MPVEGKTPSQEGVDNRTKIYNIILEKPLTFTELLEESNISKSSFNNHLNSLLDEGLAKKSLLDNKVVYVSTLDEEKLYNYFKQLSFDILVREFSDYYPEISILLKLYTRVLARSYIFDKKNEMENQDSQTNYELYKMHWEMQRDILTDEELEVLSKSKIPVIRAIYSDLKKEMKK